MQLNRAIFFGDTGTQLDELYEYAKNEATIYGKYQMFHKWRLEKIKISSHWDGLERFNQLESIAQLQQLERLQQLDKMDQLQKIEFLTLDYRSLEIGPEDVVYCDPPYVGTSKDYGGFDYKAFENWYLHECPAKEIYISEYTQLPHTEVAFNLGKKIRFSGKGKRRDELLLRVIKETAK